MARSIPIQNLYYLLCYAWDVLDERDDTMAQQLEGLSSVDLLTKLLTKSVQRLWRRGLDRGYRTQTDELRSPRGRLEVAATEQRRLSERGLASCTYDDLSHDVLHNQIITTMARTLVAAPRLAKDLRDELVAVTHLLHGISTIPLRASTFRRVQMHGRLQAYRFPLHVCELLHSQLLVSEDQSDVYFRDFVEDESLMAILFEKFVRNFCRHELPAYQVKRDQIQWDLTPTSDAAKNYLPVMNTDVTLRGEGRTIILECKFYRDAFSTHFETEKIRPGHLYQLTAYLRNLAQPPDTGPSLAGVLIYPEVKPIPTLHYQSAAHRLSVAGLNLAQDWQLIRDQLLAIVKSA